MIKHEPMLNSEKIIEHYTKKDGVPIKYVCTSAINGSEFAMDIFYRDTPHPEFGNRYFGMYVETYTGSLYITNADKIEDLEFGMIKDDNGDYYYSAHRHDYKVVDDQMIDGGRAYIRTNTKVYDFKVKNGEFVDVSSDT